MTSIGDWLQGHADLPRLDLDVVLGHTLKINRSRIIAFPERTLSCSEQEQLASAIERLRAGEPVAYITGSKEFFSLDFRVSTGVLIPRSDTELLVEAALTKLSPGDRVLDLGTGSGAIAICLARFSEATITASDTSAGALEIARDNARRLNVSVEFLLGSWFEPVTGKFSMIVSNPPYVAAGDQHLSALSFEPSQALVSGPGGLDDLTHICSQASDYLLRNGWLLLEHGFDQGIQVRSLLASAGFDAISTQRDLGGNERVTTGQWPGERKTR